MTIGGQRPLTATRKVWTVGNGEKFSFLSFCTGFNSFTTLVLNI